MLIRSVPSVRKIRSEEREHRENCETARERRRVLPHDPIYFTDGVSGK